MQDSIRNAIWYILNAILPNRPSLENKDAFVSLRAKIEGYTRNIRVKGGALVREQAWLSCLGSEASIEIGNGTIVMPFAKLVAAGDGYIRIGNHCSIHSFDVFYGFQGGLEIGNNVRIGTNVSIISGNHNFDDPTRPISVQGSNSKGIRIGNHVWIGAGVIIVDGVRIGDNAVIGAGSVVTRDVAGDSVCMGVPATIKRKRGEQIIPIENFQEK